MDRDASTRGGQDGITGARTERAGTRYRRNITKPVVGDEGAPGARDIFVQLHAAGFFYNDGVRRQFVIETRHPG